MQIARCLPIRSLLFILILHLSSRTALHAQGGYTLDFDGSTQYVEVPFDAALNPITNITIEAWARVEGGSGTYRSVVTSRSTTGTTTGYTLYAADDNTWQFWTGDNGLGTWDVLSSGVTVTNEWTHIACVYDGTNLIIYINGEQAASSTGSYFANITRPLRIGSGATETTPDYYFHGKIDEVRIWSDVRTQAEIQANMHKELTGSEGNLVGYYQMSDGSGTSLTDNSTNSNTGTLNNSPTWKTSGAHAGPGMALDFDGMGDYAYASLNAGSSSTITLESWVSFNSLSSQQNIMNVHSTSNSVIRLVPYKTAANVIYLFVYDGSNTYNVSSTFTISQTNEWHHLVFIYDAGTVQIYADGELVGNETGQGSFNTGAASQFSMGADFDGSVAGFHSNVKMDEVRIWSDVRTQAEIRQYKDRSLDGDEAGLLSYYRCDQQAASGNTTVYDHSSNGHNGTLVAMDPATDWVASSPFNTWIGSEDSDWNNADNWSRGAVPSTEDVGLFAWSGSNAPASSNISGRNFYVDAGVTATHSGDLTLSGDFYNAGTFITTGNVTFSGSSAQTLKGSGTSRFGTLTLNNSAGLTLEQGLLITSDLALTSGILNLNGQTLQLDNTTTVSGTPGNSNHVQATSGSLLKGYSGTGSFTFPIGDGSVYSPITLNFTSGSFSSGNATVNLTTSKHPNNASTTDYLNRYWTVSSSGITSFSCSVSAQYDDGDIAGTEGDLVGGKWDGSAWTDLGAVTAGSNLVTGTVSSFSDFTGGEPGVFPVEWLDFTTKIKNDQVELDWATAQESNSDYFEIERSQNQNDWSALGQVKAQGFSQSVEKYQFTDINPLKGTSYYRLRQVDFDGKFDFSPAVEVHFDSKVIAVFPNPMSDHLNLNVLGDFSIQATLFDIEGKVVLRSQLEKGSHKMDVSHLSPGVYFLHLKDKNGWNRRYQLLKK